MKPVLILQQFGLGDCIWSQSIAHKFISEGCNVIWPVNTHFLDGLQRAYPKITWVPGTCIKPEIFDIQEKIEYDGMLIAPIRWSASYMKLPYKDVMKAKYLMYDLDWKTWKDHAIWHTDLDRQVGLLEHLGIKYGDLYNLVNKKFGTHGHMEVDIKHENEFRNIEMESIPGYSIFDWAMVISGSVEIHTVSTSILYMLEVLPLNKPIHLYCRKPIENDFSFVDYIFTKPYILHE